MPTSFLNRISDKLGQDEIQNTSLTVKNETEKLKKAVNHTHYDLLKDTSMSIDDYTRRKNNPE